MSDWHKHHGGARPPSLKDGDQAECQLRGGGVVYVTVGTEPDELWHDYGGDFDVVQWRLVNARPRPGDVLSELQALRWVVDNLTAGRPASDGMEWRNARCCWDSRHLKNVGELTFLAANSRLRAALPKQRTVTIDGKEYPVPEPMREKPEMGQRYWFVRQGRALYRAWRGDDDDEEYRRHHHIYATFDEAQQAWAIHNATYGGED